MTNYCIYEIEKTICNVMWAESLSWSAHLGFGRRLFDGEWQFLFTIRRLDGLLSRWQLSALDIFFLSSSSSFPSSFSSICSSLALLLPAFRQYKIPSFCLALSLVYIFWFPSIFFIVIRSPSSQGFHTPPSSSFPHFFCPDPTLATMPYQPLLFSPRLLFGTHFTLDPFHSYDRLQLVVGI